MPQRRCLTIPAACLLFLLFLGVSTTSPPGDYAVAGVSERPTSRVKATSASADTIINLMQWQTQHGGNGHWYAILAVAHDWTEAESLSQLLVLDSMTGYLATILGQSENDFIFDSVLLGVNAPTVQDQFYLGGIKVGSGWGWVTGEPFCFENWTPGEPNHADETVISMWGPFQAAPPIGGSWNNTLSNDSANPLARFWSVIEWGDTVQAPVPVCGNGIPECGEECDDGNLVNGDGCNGNCVQEICGDGIVQPWEECDDGNLIAGDGCDPMCSLQVCGNGELEPGEECDDGNLLNDDGCDALCAVEGCGDGSVQPWEQCDDGNLIAGDGCDPLCRTEVCGNGRLDVGECCDDSNLVTGDGCSATCMDEAVVCGNGLRECSEQCDDGNLVDGDGCQATCDYTCIPGDLNSSMTATSADVICLVNYVFLGPSCVPQPCQYAGDMTCNGTITSADLIRLINFLFKSMPLAECDRCALCGG